MNQVAAFDPNTLRDKITDRIKNSFVELVPEEAWQKMVQGVIDEMLTPKSHGYNNEKRPSEMQQMIRDEITKRMKETIAKTLDQPEYQAVWDDRSGRQSAGPLVQEIIKQCAPDLVKVMFSDLVGSLVVKIHNELRR